MEMMVSIVTATYNHAPYIEQALDSFLIQKTDFPFEIIIHDDASTDGTTEIVRRYADRYPDLIHPVFQTENQLSKGVDIYGFLVPLIKGKYIAQCEGDDFWCDERKLQKQVDYMETHPECSFCFCNSYNVNLNSEIIKVVSPVNESRVFSSREMIGKPEIFLATAGTFYRTKDCMEFPKEMLAGEAGDIPLRNFLMLRGNAYGFADRMVCYRIMVPGSWSDRYDYAIRHDPEKILKINADYLHYYLRFDDYTKGKYHQELLPNIRKRQFFEYRIKSDWKAMRKPEFDTLFNEISLRLKIIYFIKYYFPFAVKMVRFIKYGKAGLKKRY